MEEPGLIIVGGGDLGRVMLRVASELPPERRGWRRIAGFLDDAPAETAAALRAKGVDTPILGAIHSYEPRPEDRFICAIASPRPKLEVCELLRSRGAVFTNLIDATAYVDPDAVLGNGIFLWRHVVVGGCARVGDFVTVQLFSSIGHDAAVGDGCTVSDYCDVMGHVELGRGVFLGGHAALLPKARVGAFARVGAGSVVLKRVKEGATVFGVPARTIDAGEGES